MFRALCAHHQERPNCINTASVLVAGSCTGLSHLHMTQPPTQVYAVSTKLVYSQPSQDTATNTE
jgi:hypothetical protein